MSSSEGFNPKELLRRGAKNSVIWLRGERRLERLLGATAVSGPNTRFSHRMIVPTSTYSPWYDDAEFMSCYERVADHTFVDIYRCYELWMLAAQTAHLPGDILEVGVWRGGTGALLARRAQLDATPVGAATEVFLADTFTGVVKASEEDPWYQGGEHADTSAEIVSQLLDSVGVTARLLAGIFPDDTAHECAERTFRFVHIDVDVYDSALGVLRWAWPRMPVGAVVVFDDYGFFECEGVAALGRELMDRHPDVLRGVHNVNGHLVLTKLGDPEGELLGGS